jgi:hypothetical protein
MEKINNPLPIIKKILKQIEKENNNLKIIKEKTMNYKFGEEKIILGKRNLS